MKLLEVPSYKQTDNDYACGPFCVAMVVDYLRKQQKKPQLNFAESQGIIFSTINGNLKRNSGTFKADLIKTIRRLGYRCNELRGSKDNRISQIDSALKRKNPVVLFCHEVIDGKPCRHYIVITGTDGNKLCFNDPYPGKMKEVAIKDFTKRNRSLYWGNSKWGIIVSIK